MLGGKIRETSCWWSQNDPRSQRTCACRGEEAKGLPRWEFREERETKAMNGRNMLWELDMNASSADGNIQSGRGRLDSRIFVKGRTPALGRGIKESKG